jgi:hypothetical protein
MKSLNKHACILMSDTNCEPITFQINPLATCSLTCVANEHWTPCPLYIFISILNVTLPHAIHAVAAHSVSKKACYKLSTYPLVAKI